MTKFSHIIKEFLKNTVRNPAATISALLSMTLLLLLFDLFWITVETSDNFYTDLLSDLKMEAYISEDASDSTIATIREFMVTDESVNSLTYISKETAREQLALLTGVDLLVGYDTTNPLPRSFEISFNNEYLNSTALSAFERKLINQDGVSEIVYGKRWLEKAESTKAIILRIGMPLGILIILTVLFNFSNNMRLTARTRADGLHQMRLLGAGKFFLAMPYFLEGVIIGAASAGIGWAIIFYWKDKIDFTQITIIFPTMEDIIIFTFVSALLGLFSGYMGVRKLMKL